MSYTFESFSGLSNKDIVEMINVINEILHDNLPITNIEEQTFQTHIWNVRILSKFLNKYNVQQIIGVPFDVNKLDTFLIYKQKRHVDNEFFNKFNNSDYKVKDLFDDFIIINTRNKLGKQQRIEYAVKRSKDVVYEAIQLINESKTHVLNKVEQKNIKDKLCLIEYYIPENENTNVNLR